nr:hypothetical protein CPBEC3_13110 [Clostridium perfringens]
MRYLWRHKYEIEWYRVINASMGFPIEVFYIFEILETIISKNTRRKK